MRARMGALYQFNREPRPPPFLALHRDPSAVQLDELAGDGEAEAGSAAGAVEAVEDARKIGGGDAGAVVGDGDARARRLDINASLGTDVRECVAHEIRE